MATKEQIQRMLKGRTPVQQSVIKYFMGSGGGCLSMFSGGLTDEQYEAIVMARAAGAGYDYKARALAKIGLDESQVNEIEPVHFENYFVGPTTMEKYGRDRKWRSSAYQISWLFFSASQVYVYQYTFNLDTDEQKEATEEYFYRDITNFSTSSETTEKEVLDTVSCSGTPTFARKQVAADVFALVVPGDKFKCSMQQSAYSERSIQGMKAKLREKKGS